MNKKAVSGILLTLLFAGITPLAVSIMKVRATRTIYIRPDGTVEGTDKIQRDGDLYTFTDNIYDSIVVERSNITIDGNGYTLQGAGWGNGFSLSGMSNVTIRSTGVKGYSRGLYMSSSSNVTISGNNITSNSCGIAITTEDILSGIAVTNNTIASNGGNGVDIESSGREAQTDTYYGRICDVAFSSNNILFNGGAGIGMVSSIAYEYAAYYYSFVYDATFSYNNVSFNGGPGISLRSRIPNAGALHAERGIYNITFLSNAVLSNGEYGLNLDSSRTPGTPANDNTYSYIHDIAFSSNNVSLNSAAGINLKTQVSSSNSESNVHNVTFLSNTVLFNRGYGINMDSSAEWWTSSSYIQSIRFSSNNVSFNGEEGVRLNSYSNGAEGINSHICDVYITSNFILFNVANGLDIYSHGYGKYGYGRIYNITLSGNTISFAGGDGVSLEGEGTGHSGGLGSGYIYDVSFLSNRILANEGDGIWLNSYGTGYRTGVVGYLYNVTFFSNIVSSNEKNGVYVNAKDHFALSTFDLLVSDNILSANRQEGIWIEGNINANFTSNSVSYNTHGVFFTTSANNVAECNDFYRNTYGMNVTNWATVNATYNYWGDASGPYHESLNANGTGNSVNGNGVDLEFIPFLTDPVGQINNCPIAMLEVDRTTVVINDTVTFDASASTDDGQVDYYFFDFGDGTNSSWTTSPMVTHEYTSHDLYNATLIVMDNLGTTSLDGDLTYVTITVFAPPVANFTYSPEFPIIEAISTFNASASYDPDGNIESYRWNFGDGNTTISAGPIVTHIYGARGAHMVNLTVTDNDGFTHGVRKSITIWEVNSIVRINVDSSKVTVGSNVTINGNITPRKTDANVTISYRQSSGSWSLLAAVKTDFNGQYIYLWETTDAGTFEIQASWSGDEYVSPARSDIKTVSIYASIYIRPDGSVDPPTAPIQRNGDLYSFTGNISQLTSPISLVVERDSIVIDGAGYTIQSWEWWGPPGIDLSNRNNITVKNTKIIGFYTGIYLASSHSNTIFGNYINSHDFGITLSSSRYNTISKNNIIENSEAGINLYESSLNTISENLVADNYRGIRLYRSSVNVILGNTINGTHNFGVSIAYSSNNKIYHNNFIFGRFQMFSGDSTNVWDDGYPSGGNYWSDYYGTDEKSGPSQDQLRSDGIGDTPYDLYEFYEDETEDFDRYPLMKPISFFDAGTWAGQPYSVDVVSNSTISDFYFSQDNKSISFDVAGPGDTVGFCRATIPNALLGGPYVVLINDSFPTTVSEWTNGTHTFIYFTYIHSTKTVEITGTTVVPEFPTWISMLLLFLVLASALVIHRRRQLKTPTH